MHHIIRHKKLARGKLYSLNNKVCSLHRTKEQANSKLYFKNFNEKPHQRKVLIAKFNFLQHLGSSNSYRCHIKCNFTFHDKLYTMYKQESEMLFAIYLDKTLVDRHPLKLDKYNCV